MSDEPGLQFDNLPLMEAAVRATFPRVQELTYELIYAVRHDLKPRLPNLTEPKQVEAAPGVGVSPAEFGPGKLPGAVYSDPDSNLSVSLHPQVVLARWVKQPTPIERPYPRYAELREVIWRAVEALRKACGDEYVGVSVVNMSYVNFIPTSDPAGVLKTYFSKEAQLPIMAGARQIRKFEGAWWGDDDDELDVRFTLEQVAARLGDQVVDGYCLTTAAGLRLGESVTARDGLDRVHDALQSFFLRLISEAAKKEWKLRSAPDV